MLFDKHFFAIENIDLVVGDFAVHQQRQVFLLHRLQYRVEAIELRDAGIGVGGGTGRIKFHPMDVFGGGCPCDFLWLCLVGEIQHHQRIELARLIGHGRKQAFAIGQRQRYSGHGRCQVGHDDGPSKVTRHIAAGSGQGSAVPQVYMPVIGAGYG